jgi:hypothetical protein
MDLEKVSRDDWTLGGVALLLVIDLLFLPWFSIGGGSVGGISIPSFDFTATDAPDGWLGILAVLATVAVIADLAIERLSPQTQLPAIQNSRTNTRFVLAAAAAVFLVLKFLFHLSNFSDLGFGFWVAVVITGALVFFTMQLRAGGPMMPRRRAGRAGAAGPPTV